MALIKGTVKTGQTINGTANDDHIVALGGNDTIFGGAGNDHINAGAGNDNVWGGLGDDLLNGNGGADKFHYSFTVTTGSGTSNFGGFDPGEDGKLVENEFVHQYDAWLATLGTDLNNDGIITVSNNNGSPTNAPTVEGYTGTFSAKTPIDVYAGQSNVHTRYYSGSASVGGVETVTSTDGHDTIADFHVGLDSLALHGLSLAQFQAHFAMDDSIDVNGDLVNDTVITINGDTTFSITLLGVSGYSLVDFYGAGV